MATAFTSAPTSGSLAPGASVDVTVVIDRTWPIEGPLKPARITFVAAGTSADVALTAEIAREPDLTIVVPPPRQLCFAGSGLFWEVTIADETLPITAVARIALPDGTSISVTFIEDGAFWYGGTVLDPSRKGSVPTGLWKWTVIATDGFGNAARTSGTTDVQRRFC